MFILDTEIWCGVLTTAESGILKWDTTVMKYMALAQYIASREEL